MSTAVTDTALTFILSNKAPGYLIDSQGDNNLFEVLKALQPVSGGAIPLEFVNQLAGCPPGSDVFTATLNNFGGLNNPVCINNDRTLTINPIFGKQYFQHQGYSTYNDTLDPVGLKLFTSASRPEFYIDAGASVDNSRYKAFAIAWSDPSVGIPFEETSQRSPSIYPNPFCTGFYITDLSEKTQLEILDVRGKRIYYTEPKPNSMIQPGPMPKGMYILKLINCRGSWQQKIVKY